MPEPTPGPDLPLLRSAYRDIQEPGSDACPSAEALVELAIGERRTGDEGLADHVIGCRRCSDDMQILLRTHAETSADGAGPAAAQSRRRMAATGAIAAVVAIALGGLLFLRRAPAAGTEGAERGRDSEESALVTPPAGAELAAPPEEFDWPAQPGAQGYRVTLYDASGAALWRSERVATARAGLPPAKRELLRPGAVYLWRVEVEGALDTTRLGPFTFRLAGR